MARTFTRIGVVGLGTMGAGIVEVFARDGLEVVGVEPSEDALERGREHLRTSTDRAVSRGRLSEVDRDALVGRVQFTTSMEDLGSVDLVLEAVPERLDLKQEVFAAAAKVCGPETVLATNTSSLPVTEIAMGSGRPEMVVGMHFFNPAPVLRLVEVVRTVVTDEDVVADVSALATRLGKVPVVVGDRAGFIANALLFGYLNRAVTMYESGHASREDIDTAMRVACGYPLGPLALLDLIGLDTACQILLTMHAESGDRLHAPAPLLRQLVAAGLLGRKSGRGIYTYSGRGSGTVVDDERTAGASSGSGGQAEALAVTGNSAVVAEVVAVLGAVGVRVVPKDQAGPGELAVLAVPDSTTPVVEAAATAEVAPGAVGLHLIRRPEGRLLVELVPTVVTAQADVAAVRNLCVAAGLDVVVCRDRAGFVVDSLLLPYLNDAVRMFERGYAGADDIDAAMVLGCGYPEGPLAALQRIGLDVVLTGLRALHRESPDPALVPAPLLQHLVTTGTTAVPRAAGPGSAGRRE